MAKDEFRPRGLIEMSKVAAVCTTNDPIDDLKYHELIAKDNFKVKFFQPLGLTMPSISKKKAMLPTLNP